MGNQQANLAQVTKCFAPEDGDEDDPNLIPLDKREETKKGDEEPQTQHDDTEWDECSEIYHKLIEKHEPQLNSKEGLPKILKKLYMKKGEMRPEWSTDSKYLVSEWYYKDQKGNQAFHPVQIDNLTTLIIDLKPNLYFKRGDLSFLEDLLMSFSHMQNFTESAEDCLDKLHNSGYDIKRMWELTDHHLFVRYYITEDNTLNTGCWLKSERCRSLMKIMEAHDLRIDLRTNNKENTIMHRLAMYDEEFTSENKQFVDFLIQRIYKHERKNFNNRTYLEVAVSQKSVNLQFLYQTTMNHIWLSPSGWVTIRAVEKELVGKRKVRKSVVPFLLQFIAVTPKIEHTNYFKEHDIDYKKELSKMKSMKEAEVDQHFEIDPEIE